MPKSILSTSEGNGADGLRKSVYEIITERLLEKLEAGTVPWHKPWNATGGAPRNLISGREYRGVNVFLLGCQAFTSPFWLTFNQARSLGGSVRKGERSTPCVLWKWIARKNENTETGEIETKQIPLIRYYSVFNAEQCDNISHARLEAKQDEPEPFNPIESAEAIVSGYPKPPSLTHDGRGSAYYRPATDSIHTPTPETFDSEEHYYSTLFHEMAHSTGHESRLARPGITNPIRHASHEYSQEELVAEMGAAFLLAEAGIDAEGLVDNSASYIQSWLRALRSDAKLVIFAGAQAQKAVDHILDRSSECEAAE